MLQDIDNTQHEEDRKTFDHLFVICYQISNISAMVRTCIQIKHICQYSTTRRGTFDRKKTFGGISP